MRKALLAPLLACAAIVAGTIGALDNADGVVGVAPGARLWAVRVLSNAGSGSFADIICGIDFVTANASEIEVANMSLSGTGSDLPCGSNQDAMHEAICVGCRRVRVRSSARCAAARSCLDVTTPRRWTLLLATEVMAAVPSPSTVRPASGPSG